MKTVVEAGQVSWKFAANRVEAFVTRQGGHLAPVRFRLRDRIVEPFAIAPWAEEKLPAATPAVLRMLRGDFFCAPFGDNATAHRGTVYPPHGASAQARWRFEALEQTDAATEIRLSLAVGAPAGRIDKTIRLRRDETALYCRHVLSGFAGPMNLGHHAMLRFPDAPGSGIVGTSPLRFAQVTPVPLEDPAQGGYSALKTGAVFSRLDRVPTVDGTATDLSRYPARRGFEDLVMLVHEAEPDFAWTAVTFPRERYVWFALKDPRVLRSTVLWISNGGRHYAPWNGRHVNVLGLEDVTAYFNLGLAESARPNPVNRRGFPTALRLSPTKPLVVSYIMAVAELPTGFDRVKSIRRTPGGVALRSANGRRVETAIDTSFLNPL